MKQRFERLKEWGSGKRSIRLRFTLMFITILIATIGLCIFLNLNFLENYYIQKKQKSIIEEIGAINHTFERYQFEGNVLDMTAEMEEEINTLLSDYWRKNNISAVIIGTDGSVLFGGVSEMVNLSERLSKYFYENNMDVRTLYKHSAYKIVLFQDVNKRNMKSVNRYMDAFGFLDSGCAFLVSTPIESIQESTSISNQFYVYSGLIVAFFSGIYIFFAMKRMTNPILELSDIASRMARQDFGTKYKGDAVDEIGVLGSSINHLSSELEKAIAELKSANEQLKKDIEEKIQIDDMRKEFLSNVSHELKTPIALIQGYAEGLQECVNDDPESRDFYCEVIMDEAGKMNQMVQKLLNLNHLEFGNDACEFTEFDLLELLREMPASAQMLLQNAGISGKVRYLEQVEDAYVSGDEFMIEEVLKNYISNACNHLSSDGEIRVTVENSAENRVRVSVFNTGNTIAEDELDKIWIKFYKIDKARTRAYGGSGIGLSIVKAIMDKHSCPYGVYNNEDGVTFWFEMNRI